MCETGMGSAAEERSQQLHLMGALTYIFPASSSRAHREETSQLPDVRKRGGTVGTAGCVTHRDRAEEKRG